MSAKATRPARQYLANRRAGAVPQTLLGARIRDLRVSAGWTQARLASCVGTGSGRVSDWELGIIEPTLPLLKRIADAFGITTSDLLKDVL